MRLILILGLALALLSGCGDSSNPPATGSEGSGPLPSPTATPTATPSATASPAPTASPIPTGSPVPSPTPSPTPTPTPSPTPTATPLPTPDSGGGGLDGSDSDNAVKLYRHFNQYSSGGEQK